MKQVYSIIFILIFIPCKIYCQITDTISLQHIFSQIDSLNKPADISLEAGWGMFGLGGCKENIDISFFDQYDQVIMIKDNNGAIYLPSMNYSGIEFIEPGQGYQIKLNAPLGPLSFCEGVSLPTIEDLNLDSLNLLEIYDILTTLNPPFEHFFNGGWNMFETTCTNTYTIGYYYYQYFLLIKHWNAQVFWPEFQFGYDDLNPGFGFQMKVYEDWGPVSFCEGINLPVYPGCIDEEALNYNSLTSEDDGSCVYE